MGLIRRTEQLDRHTRGLSERLLGVKDFPALLRRGKAGQGEVTPGVVPDHANLGFLPGQVRPVLQLLPYVEEGRGVPCRLQDLERPGRVRPGPIVKGERYVVPLAS